MIYAPSPTVDNGGRDAGGRFVGGNRFARGNPHHRQVARLRSALLDAVQEDDLTAIVRALVDKARQGDVMAAREVLDRCLGKAKQPLDVELETRSAYTLPPFHEMSDVEIATYIVEGGMADRLPPILRKKLELIHGGQWEEAIKLRAQQKAEEEAAKREAQSAPHTTTKKKVRRAPKKKAKNNRRMKPAKQPADTVSAPAPVENSVDVNQHDKGAE